MTIPQRILWGWALALVIAAAQSSGLPIVENIQILIATGQDAWHTHQPHELD